MRNFYINRHLSAKLCLGILMLAIPIFVLSLGLLFVKTNENIRQEAGDQQRVSSTRRCTAWNGSSMLW